MDSGRAYGTLTPQRLAEDREYIDEFPDSVYPLLPLLNFGERIRTVSMNSSFLEPSC